MKLPGIFAALFCGLVLLAACKKNENNNSTPTRTQMLVAGKWQMTAGTATLNYMGTDTTIDLYSEVDECDKDDFILFASDGTGTIDENTNKCADDNQVEGFTWALLNNDTRLALVDSNPDTMDILEITGAQFKLERTKPNNSGIPVTTVYTYKNIN